MSQLIAQQLFDNPDKDYSSNQLFITTNRHILDAYVYLIDIEKNDTITKCLYKLLETIILPVHAQKLDVLAESYAKRLFELNRFQSQTADGLYVLLYSMLMLKHDLYESKTSKKMSVNDFIHTSRGIYDGDDFSTEFLTQIYDEIKQNFCPTRDRKCHII